MVAISKEAIGGNVQPPTTMIASLPWVCSGSFCNRITKSCWLRSEKKQEPLFARNFQLRLLQLSLALWNRLSNRMWHRSPARLMPLTSSSSWPTRELEIWKSVWPMAAVQGLRRQPARLAQHTSLHICRQRNAVSMPTSSTCPRVRPRLIHQLQATPAAHHRLIPPAIRLYRPHGEQCSRRAQLPSRHPSRRLPLIGAKYGSS